MTQFTAKEGHVFDWREPIYIGADERGNLIKLRLYKKHLYLDKPEDIEKYIELPLSAISDREFIKDEEV